MAIKLIDPTVRFEIVSEFDEAVVPETAEELKELTAKGETTRFGKYLDSLNLADLKLDESKDKPTLFVIRCLTNDELADIQDRHLEFDVATRRAHYKSYTKYLSECFDLGVLGIKKPDGSIQKVSSKDVEQKHFTSVGGTISYSTTIGKHLKNG